MATWDADRIKKFAKKMRYQKFVFPGGIESTGIDRSPMAEQVLPADMTGQSVLDIGCYVGFYCIEAKKRGAGLVVGIEAEDEQFGRAQQIREIFGYDDIQYIQGFFPGAKLPVAQFDTILCLNVVHHYGKEKTAREVLLQLAGMTRKRLSLSIRPPGSGQFSPPEDADKPFAYTHPPFFSRKKKKILLSPGYIQDLLGGSFSSIRIMAAPSFEDRFVAVCDK
jgi:SAM-dependent methyltransferase